MNESTQSAPLVEVLLATYNGARFLREQIDSILAQTYTPIRILARDDGSRDETTQILADYAAQYPDRFRIITGTPTGHPKFNFARLIEASTAPYLAFSDQDDVWLPEKISLGMNAMRALEQKNKPTTPLVVFSDLRVVDANLETVHASFWAHQPIRTDAIHSLRRILVQNTITGNTALINRPLATLAQTMPACAHMHDWWIAVLASAFGDAMPLQQQLVLYRQHNANVLGASVGGGTRTPIWRYKHHPGYLQAWEEAVAMARALLEAYGDRLTASQRRTANRLVAADQGSSAIQRISNYLSLRLFLFGGLRQTVAMLYLVADLPNARKMLHSA